MQLVDDDARHCVLPVPIPSSKTVVDLQIRNAVVHLFCADTPEQMGEASQMLTVAGALSTSTLRRYDTWLIAVDLRGERQRDYNV